MANGRNYNMSAESMMSMTREEAQEMAERQVAQTSVEPRTQTPQVETRVTPQVRPTTSSAEAIERSRAQAEDEAVRLGFRRSEIHQMRDGLFMAGPTHELYEAALRDFQIRAEQDSVTDARDARSVRDVAIETLTRDTSGRGRAVVVTGRRATLLAREVSTATSVEILVTGVESGAQKRITVNITPGPSVINRPINGNRSPVSVRSGTRPEVDPAVTTREQTAIVTQRTQETAQEVVQRVVDSGATLSAESIAQELARR